MMSNFNAYFCRDMIRESLASKTVLIDQLDPDPMGKKEEIQPFSAKDGKKRLEKTQFKPIFDANPHNLAVVSFSQVGGVYYFESLLHF